METAMNDGDSDSGPDPENPQIWSQAVSNDTYMTLCLLCSRYER